VAVLQRGNVDEPRKIKYSERMRRLFPDSAQNNGRQDLRQGRAVARFGPDRRGGPRPPGRAGVVARPGPPEAGRHRVGRQNNMY